MKKYSLIESDRSNEKQKLYQIQALKTFTTSNGTKVKEGDFGGFISGEHNLSHEGNCWVANNAEVWDQPCVSENAYLGGFSSLSDQVQLYGNAKVIRGEISGNVKIYDNAKVAVKGGIKDEVEIFDNAQIGGNSFGSIRISDNVQIYGNAKIEATCDINGNVEIQ